MAPEYRGNVFEEMSMDGRMTVCNMSIEAGARCGMIAPDETTFSYLKDRKFTPENFDAACADFPAPADETDAGALDYMQLKAGEKIAGTAVDKVFIGSCTNSRLEDLRAAAAIFKGRKVAPNVTTLIVPGSVLIKARAESPRAHWFFLAPISTLTKSCPLSSSL